MIAGGSGGGGGEMTGTGHWSVGDLFRCFFVTWRNWFMRCDIRLVLEIYCWGFTFPCLRLPACLFICLRVSVYLFTIVKGWVNKAHSLVSNAAEKPLNANRQGFAI